MQRIYTLVILGVFGLTLIGCGSKEDQSNVNAAPNIPGADMNAKPPPVPAGAPTMGGPSGLDSKPLTKPGG